MDGRSRDLWARRYTDLRLAKRGNVVCWMARLLADHRSARVVRTPPPRTTGAIFPLASREWM